MPTITSKNTSVNSTKVPAIYNKLSWVGLYNWFRQEKGYRTTFRIFDIGCGRNPQLIHDFLADEFKSYAIRWEDLPYDPYWLDENINNRSLKTWYDNREDIGCVICSNVLNVLENDTQVIRLLEMMRKGWKENGVPYFITVYEGDKSGIGKVTKNDCYQRNLRTKAYLDLEDKGLNEVVYKGVITPYVKHNIIIK